MLLISHWQYYDFMFKGSFIFKQFLLLPVLFPNHVLQLEFVNQNFILESEINNNAGAYKATCFKLGFEPICQDSNPGKTVLRTCIVSTSQTLCVVCSMSPMKHTVKFLSLLAELRLLCRLSGHLHPPLTPTGYSSIKYIVLQLALSSGLLSVYEPPFIHLAKWLKPATFRYMLGIEHTVMGKTSLSHRDKRPKEDCRNPYKKAITLRLLTGNLCTQTHMGNTQPLVYHLG